MASNQLHDRSTVVASVVTSGLAIYYKFPLDNSLILGISTLFGGYFLSCDLDIYSIPYRRWSWLRWWWIPYRKWHGHRGWGHCPFLGTVSRLLWTIPFWLPIIHFAKPNKNYLIAVLIGLEISEIIHIVLDFLPHITLVGGVGLKADNKILNYLLKK